MRKKSHLFVRACFAALVITSLASSCKGPDDTGTGVGNSPVNLKSAADFVILAKTGVSTTGTTTITGDIGVSPAAETYLTGFGQASSGSYSTSTYVTGKLYAADMVVPTPSKLTIAVGDMEAAYTFAAGRTKPDYLNLGAGSIGSRTLSPGLYKWGSTVSFDTDLTINGSIFDTWIFQIDGNLTVGNAAKVILTGGALASNIVWQVAGEASLGTTSQFKGTILCQTAISMKTGATLSGRLLAQSMVSLDQSTVVN